MKRIAKPIETTDNCSYGCGLVARFVNGSGKLMCDKSSNSCPAVKKRNSNGLKNSNRNYREIYNNLPEQTKERMKWSKGLTKELDSRLARPQAKGKRFGTSLTGFSEETKRKISKKRSEWLKKSENRKNLGRHKRSWLESTFEQYLIEHDITGWDTEIHFFNDKLGKNYYPDFIFNDRMLIIELDGTQHRKSLLEDSVRDEWFRNKGYRVIRITVEEFKQRYFSGKGFLDLLGR